MHIETLRDTRKSLLVDLCSLFGEISDIFLLVVENVVIVESDSNFDRALKLIDGLFRN